MTDRIRLNRVANVLTRISYPTDREEAASAFDDITLLYADGEGNLGELIRNSDRAQFDSADDLHTELHNQVPIEAVGEPGQSEGDA